MQNLHYASRWVCADAEGERHCRLFPRKFEIRTSPPPTIGTKPDIARMNVQMNPRRTACLPASRLGCGGGCLLLVLRVEEYRSSGHTYMAVELSNPIPLSRPVESSEFLNLCLTSHRAVTAVGSKIYQ